MRYFSHVTTDYLIQQKYWGIFWESTSGKHFPSTLNTFEYQASLLWTQSVPPLVLPESCVVLAHKHKHFTTVGQSSAKWVVEPQHLKQIPFSLRKAFLSPRFLTLALHLLSVLDSFCLDHWHLSQDYLFFGLLNWNGVPCAFKERFFRLFSAS